METIHRSATHLLGIINDIITLRTARTGMNLKQELVRLSLIVYDVAWHVKPPKKLFLDFRYV